MFRALKTRGRFLGNGFGGRRSGFGGRASFGTSRRRGGYEDTVKNLRIGRETRVIFQGFTGKQATINVQESIQWGQTNIVGGVRPNITSLHLGLPVLPTAMEELKPDATGIYVAAHQAPAAIEEAIEAQIPLIVAVAEHIPLHDMLRIHSILKTQSKSRLLGPNTPGIISATGKCRIGFQPLPCFSSGRVGIVAKSGTLSYEAVASTTRAGLGQTLCIGVGGDPLPGTTFLDALQILEHDAETEGIILIGEIGGDSELEAAAWIKEYQKRAENPKPIAALVAGITYVEGKVMGHAGAFLLPGDPDALTKIRGLEDAGVTIVNHPAKFGDVMTGLLRHQTPTWRKRIFGSMVGSAAQTRGMHMMRKRPLNSEKRTTTPNVNEKLTGQKRTYFQVREDAALNMLREKGFNAGEYSGKGKGYKVAVVVDRRTCSPAIILPSSALAEATEMKPIPFDYLTDLPLNRIPTVSSGLTSYVSQTSLPKLIQTLVLLFKQHQAIRLEATFVERLGDIKVVGANFILDEAVLKQKVKNGENVGFPLQETRTEEEKAIESEVEKAGIVYIPLPNPSQGRNIATLVNGAGLAMNTIDALSSLGGFSTNFLDTGGKATSDTVKRSLRIILGDKRVKVVFVNVFGGLTRGEMIAVGVVDAVRELEAEKGGMRVPIVVRIRGTGEEDGRRIIAESKLPLHAFDDFEEAAAKAIELSAL
ncbi:hypothetical protein HYFRA_00012915 [Hymenoscyphus fraxineus]|uniref:CoA-binding domain-containing protein n=1 Tax=Hymenoscyphus fraxineus TaxID=746836 RepID=A0A9N9L6E3_9HELO|nr:hypothetical protein HYFRA_00012915 [Hymenoscyphus fraxineus]